MFTLKIGKTEIARGKSFGRKFSPEISIKIPQKITHVPRKKMYEKSVANPKTSKFTTTTPALT
jgi:hypothetical protein